MFDASKLPTKTIGGATLTNNGDGSFTISGSGNLSTNFNYYYYMGRNPLKVGRLTLKLNGPNSIVPLMQVIGLNKLGDGSNQNRVWDIVNEASIDITQELLEQTKDIYIVFYGNQGKEIKPGTIKPMLYQDGDGTWEQYTGGKPAPNPDYPMDIENVEISEITSHGRNLLPYPYYCGGIGTKNTQSGIDFEILPDKSFKLSGTATSACYINLSRIDFGGDEFKDDHYIGLVGSSNENITLVYNANNKITSIYVSQNATIDTIVYPMISKGKQVPEWEAPTGYNTTSTNLTLAQDDIYQNGAITRARKQVTFDGSADENWIQSGELTNVIRFKLYHGYQSVNFNGVSNLFAFEANYNNDVEHFYVDATAIVVFINKSRLESLDSNGFKKWLQAKNLEVELVIHPTTEEFKVPTIPSYEPYTEISTNSVVDPTITFRPLPFTTCLVGEATEEESGYMPPLSGNSNEFLNGNGEWSVPSGYTLPTASSTVLGGVKIGENITISSGTISIDKEDVTGALGYTPPKANTTYEKVDKSSDGLCPKLPNETTTTKYLRQDGSWAVPPNTTYSVATTSKNGLMSSNDKAKLTNLRRIWKGTSSSPPSGWVDGDIYIQYEE